MSKIAHTSPPILAPGYEGCRQLARALRAKTFPKDFYWFFGTTSLAIDDEKDRAEFEEEENVALPEGWCGTAGCAIGLAHVLWPRQVRYETDWDDLRELLRMSRDEFRDIFIKGADTPLVVTPETVADRLDAYLTARGEKPS